MKTNIKKVFFVFLFIHSFNFLEAQSDAQFVAAMPNILPTTPEISGLLRYLEYPVNLYTGLVDISIPLYEIKTKDFVVPITLKYHSSGIKVTDVASWVGLGWSLDVGGTISRKVNGKPDDEQPRLVMLADTINPYEDTDWFNLQGIETGVYDSEPDLFMYNFPGESGRFIFNSDHQPVYIPHSPIILQKTGNPIQSFSLKDCKGNKYFYGDIFPVCVNYASKSGGDPISTWMLSKMSNANNTDSIEFFYQSAGSGVMNEDRMDYISVIDEPYSSGGGYIPTPIIQPYTPTLQTVGEEKVPYEIHFQEGVVKFVLTNDFRQDRYLSTIFKSLEAIEIYSKNNLTTPIKTIDFYKSYFINNQGHKRLRLDSVRIYDQEKQKYLLYKFDYNETNKLPEYLSRQRDLWGYYNGKSNNILVPNQSIAYKPTMLGIHETRIIGSNIMDGREPDPEKMKAYIIKRITYPTGGYSEFEFETNRYADGEQIKYAGGLRIAGIVNCDGFGNVLRKTYKYPSYGRLNVFLNNFTFNSGSLVTIGQYWTDGGLGHSYSSNSRIYTSSPSVDINPYDGSPVVYSSVTEYDGDSINNKGLIVYQYSDEPDYFTVLTGHYNLSLPIPLPNIPRNREPKIIMLSRSYKRGLLLRKTIYKNVNGNYIPVSSTENEYFVYPENNQINVGLAVWRDVEYIGGTSSNYRDFYNYDNYHVFTGDNKIKYSAEYTYDNLDNTKYVKKETFFNYNNPTYLQVSTIKSVLNREANSSDTLFHNILYATDFSTPIYKKMKDSSMISYPIVEQRFMNQNALDEKRTNYILNNQGFISPSSVEIKKGQEPFETRIAFNEYDEWNNLRSVNKINDLNTSYIWCYNGQYPVIKAANVDFATINNTVNSIQSNLQNFLINTVGNLTTTAQRTAWKSFNTALRNHTSLSKAQVYTYTYKPLVGMTSETDPNGVTTYYEYDGFGRLKYVKDDDGNILKSHEYHYKE